MKIKIILYDNVENLIEYMSMNKFDLTINILDLNLPNISVIDKKKITSPMNIMARQFKNKSLHIAPYINNIQLNKFLNNFITSFSEITISDFLIQRFNDKNELINYCRNIKFFKNYTTEFYYYNESKIEKIKL